MMNQVFDDIETCHRDSDRAHAIESGRRAIVRRFYVRVAFARPAFSRFSGGASFFFAVFLPSARFFAFFRLKNALISFFVKFSQKTNASTAVVIERRIP